MAGKMRQWGHVFAGVMIGIFIGFILCLSRIERVFSFDTFNRLYAQTSGINYARGCIENLRILQGDSFKHEDAKRCRIRGREIEVFIYNYITGKDTELKDIDPEMTIPPSEETPDQKKELKPNPVPKSRRSTETKVVLILIGHTFCRQT